jgi:hypothetical protein
MCTKVHYKPFPLCFLSKEETMSTGLLLQPTPQFAAPQPPRLLDQIAQAARQRGASEPTTAQLVSWARAFILFQGKRHPRELGAAEVEQFLTHLAVNRHVSASAPGWERRKRSRRRPTSWRESFTT